jgi:hypothetical protein
MQKALRIIQWTPRILCILAILFVSMFALDSFDSRLTLWQQISGFLIHLIPTYILIIFLVVAWKWELIGGIILAILGLGFSPLVFTMNYHMNHSVAMSLGVIALITLPFVLIGALFILSHFVKKRHG